MKHGGVSEEDVEDFIKGKTFEEIDLNSTFLLTIDKKIVLTDNGIDIEKK
jgi:hypothetical protein